MSAPNDEARIKAILERRKSQRNPGGLPWEEVATMLASLCSHSGAALVRQTKWAIRNLSQTDEGEVLTLLQTLALIENEETVSLASAALREPQTLLKEDYAALLDFLGRGDVADEIMGFVLMFAAQGNERPDLKVVLRALHARGAQNFASLGRPFVANSSVEIRGEALGFLYDCDSPEAGSIFLDRLLEETDPELIQFIIDGLVMWHYVAATPGLLSLSEDPAHPAEVRAAARDALANLAADTEL